MIRSKPFAVVIRVLAVIFVAVLLFVLAVNLLVWSTVKNRIVDVDNAIMDEEFDCILILGAGVRADGTPSSMLEDRLEIGIELYFAGASDRILMSGDHMQRDYDEVTVMKRHATDAGVPGKVIFLDHAGLSTYESIWRAKEIYGVDKVLIVTQEYHLYRALYTAKVLGMEAYGVSSDLRPYSKQTFREARELVARVKDFVFAHVKPEPTYIGDPIDLSGDGDSTNTNPFWSK